MKIPIACLAALMDWGKRETWIMFKHLGRFAAAHPWMICAAWVIAGVCVTLAAPNWDRRAQDDDIRFLPGRCDSVRGYHLLQEAFPQDVFASRVLFAVERPDGVLTHDDLAAVDGAVVAVNALRDEEPALQIGSVNSHRDLFIGKRLLSDDGHCTLIQVSLGTPYLAVQTKTTVDRAEERVRKSLADAGGSGLQVYTTGPAGIGHDLISAGGDSLDKTTVATIILVVVILLFVYRAPLLALVPLATIAGSVWIALKLLALCTLIPGFHLVNISQIFAVVMLYGAGTDYCLFLISRYREELAQGHERSEALSLSVGHVGGALAASAGTVIVGLGMMGFAEFAKVRSGGPAIAIGLAVALVASLTLAPALLQLLGNAVFWPCGVPKKVEASAREGLWSWLSKLVSRRPVAIWATAVAILLPLAIVGLQVKANYRATGELSPTSSSVAGLGVIQKHFTAGEVGPVTVLLDSETDWDSKSGRELIAHLSEGISRLDNVAEVRSLTQPLGTALAPPAPTSPPPTKKPRFSLRGAMDKFNKGVDEQVQRTAKEHYVARIDGGGPTRYVTRLDVVPRTDPFDPQSQPTLDMVQIWLREEMPKTPTGMTNLRAECYGVTVNARDLADVTESDRVRINGLVLAGVFVILLVLVRRPWLAAYLLVTVLFSYYATLGATTLMATWWSGRTFGLVDWRVPFFLFTILVAVGEDYNILLITRALKERKRHGADAGMQRALAHTGGTITSCGLIMAGTFATLMLAGLNTLVQIGFALAFGVLLDTFLVRPFLVPALVLWMWRREEERGRDAVTLPLPAKEYRRAV
jgi:RND superfamily putative drug exporter